MNGVSRFLSRREKHHEKRNSKHHPSKVLPPFLSYPPSSPALSSSPGIVESSRYSPRRPRNPSSSLYSLYHKLPSLFQTAGEDRFLFLQKKPPSVDVTPFIVQVSTLDSSDHVTLQSQPVPSHLYTIFSHDESKTPDKDEKKVGRYRSVMAQGTKVDIHQIKTLTQRLQAAGITNFGEAQIQYALSQHPNDLDQVYNLLLLANDSFEGILKDYDPNLKMLGAINRNMVTCYLDALLFAMFARLDSFEAMLFDNFSDEPRKKLAATLRLWVNLLRTGRLIGVELVKSF